MFILYETLKQGRRFTKKSQLNSKGEYDLKCLMKQLIVEKS